MAKNILIFSDGTGQIGGLRPDQRLSNVYKMYRAMRPGPESPIKPSSQVAYYDPGLGAGELGGDLVKRLKKKLEAAVGTGIDDNVIDCYEKVISYYEPGDKVLLFGFSRGAYTVRALANVMNLCGIPTQMKDGSPIPKHGKELRKIATDAVKYVYNHGAGKPRGEEPYYTQREEKGRRFRNKYGSVPLEGPDVQGNVQPTFIGVFDTVAALENSLVIWLVRVLVLGLVSALGILLCFQLTSWYYIIPLMASLMIVGYWYLKLFLDQYKYFSPDPNKSLRLKNVFHWWLILKYGHLATWKKKNYDKYLDSGVGYARHALAIDEPRADFPRVKWASRSEAIKNQKQEPKWLKQVWFAGCHSDVGGSYPEEESRLSDIALDWMVTELKVCVPTIRIREEILVRSPDPLGLQHAEKTLKIGPFVQKWKLKPREITPHIPLHPSVITRLEAETVPQMGTIKAYRPPQLQLHSKAKKYYSEDDPT